MPEPKPIPTLDIIPLGGVNEIGKNMTAYQCGDDIVVVDAGLMFPDDELLGVDILIPDVTFLVQNADKVRGILLTHGHEDHIGGLPYVLKQLNVPVWGTPLTLGLCRGKLDEHRLGGKVVMNSVQPGDRVRLGCFEAEFIAVTHSIPGATSIALRTPRGNVLHTSDFKFDPTPIDGRLTDFARLAAVGAEGVLLLVSDTTNVEKAGHSLSERVVAGTLDTVFRNAERRVIVASFASNVHRIQQVANAAARYGRKMAFVGRSMVTTVRIARELGYLDVPDDLVIPVDQVDQLWPAQVCVMTTGSQGEPLSALTRIAVDEHNRIRIERGDTVIISAHPIPGNEDLVWRTVNNLFRRGAKVIYDEIAPVHASGHANQDELRLMLNLARPQYVVPVHGEPRHLARYRELAQEMGFTDEQICRVENGDRLRFGDGPPTVVERVPGGTILVDGIGVGEIGDVVLRDRQHLSQDGIFVVVLSIDRETGEVLAGPDMISRGFVFEKESEQLLNEARKVILDAVADVAPETTEWTSVRASIKRPLSKLLYDRTGRRPMVLPLIQEV